ncbi:MAG: hypothetical protein AAFU73_05105 [Planctomycetota bacterium]
MKARTLFALLLATIAALLLRSLLHAPDLPAPDVETPTPAAADAEDGIEPLLAEPYAGSEGAASASPVSAREAVPEEFRSAQGADAIDERTHLVGTLLLPSGAPAQGAKLSVTGWGGNAERVAKYGKPDAWENPVGAVDAEGRFDLAFLAPRAFQFVLTAELDGHAGLSWRWSELVPGDTTDVGVQTFEPACTVTGAVVDASGASTGIAWTVYGESLRSGRRAGPRPTRARALVDAATGRFRIDGLPAGRVRLRAYSMAANWIDGPEVEVREAGPTEARIEYRGPTLETTITVQTSSQPFYTEGHPAPESIVARDARGSEHRAVHIAGSSSSYRIEGLSPGPYTVEVEDERFETWRQEDVWPGTTLRVALKGRARVKLAVVDDATGAPIERYSLRACLDESRSFPNTFDVLSERSEPPSGGVVTGFMPLQTTLFVRAAGYAPAEVDLGQLDPDVTPAVEVRLVQGASLTVLAVDAFGAPVALQDVQLHPFPEGYVADGSLGQSIPRGRFDDVRAATLAERTDAEGRVTFEPLAPGAYGLFSRRGTVEARVERLEVTAGQAREATLTFAGAGVLEGTLTGAREGKYESLRVAVMADRPRRHGRTTTADEVVVPVDAAGRFRAEELAPGPSFVLLLPHEPPARRGMGGLSVTVGDRTPIGEVVVEPGATVEASFDIEDHSPGSLAVQVRVNDAPASGLSLELRSRNGRGTLGGELDADGRLVLPAVLPGTWAVEVRDRDARWSFKEAPLVELGPAADEEVLVEIRTARSGLLVIDAATGRPAAGRTVRIDQLERRTLDADGVLELERPLGTVRIRADRPGPPSFGAIGFSQESRVDWGPAGPLVPSITLHFDDD